MEKYKTKTRQAEDNICNKPKYLCMSQKTKRHQNCLYFHKTQNNTYLF